MGSKRSTINCLQSVNNPTVDVNNKMILAQNVLAACLTAQSERHLLSKLYSLLFHKSDVQKTLLEDIMINMRRDADAEKPNSVFDAKLRQGLLNIYRWTLVPTITLLQMHTGEIYSREAIRERLNKNGYIFKRLPNTNRHIIIEDPKQSIAAQRFLEKMTEYRKQNRIIVYVMEKIVDKDNKDIKYLKDYIKNNTCAVFIAVASAEKYIGGQFLGCSSVSKCQETAEKYFLKFILPNLSDQSVIVLKGQPIHNMSMPVPTMYNKKCAMEKWLDFNGIPYDKSYHRSELFELIRRRKFKTDLHKFDVTLKAHGHEVIRRPLRNDSLDFFAPYWERCKLPIKLKYSNEHFATKTSNYWQTLEKTLVLAEQTAYSEYVEIENITDRILHMAKNIDITSGAEAECDKEEDGLIKSECFVDILN